MSAETAIRAAREAEASGEFRLRIGPRGGGVVREEGAVHDDDSRA
jgi:hypothetical protein